MNKMKFELAAREPTAQMCTRIIVFHWVTEGLRGLVQHSVRVYFIELLKAYMGHFFGLLHQIFMFISKIPLLRFLPRV